MKKISKSLAIALTFLPSLSIAQVITGFVNEKIYGMGVENVRVHLKDQGDTVFTDSTGYFQYEKSLNNNPEYTLSQNGYFLQPFSNILFRTQTELPALVTIRTVRNQLISRQLFQPNVDHIHLDLENGLNLITARCGSSTTILIICSINKKVISQQVVGRRPLELEPLQKFTGDGDTLVFSKEGWEPYEYPVTDAGPLDIKLTRKKIRTLIIEGFSNHNWRYLTKFYKALFEESGFFTISVAASPEALPDDAAYNDFKPEFSKYELLIMNIINIPAWIDWPQRLREEFEDYMKTGGAMLAPHGANYSFSTWIEYSKMIGHGWRGSDFGPTLEIIDDELFTSMDNKTTSHPSRTDAIITNLGSHPCKKGFPAEWLVTDTEIYTHPKIVEGNLNNITVLSYANSGNRNWPMESITKYQKGLSYVNGMGHLTESSYHERIADLGFQTCLIRAGEWLARQEIAYPVPPNFPSRDKTEYNWDLIIP